MASQQTRYPRLPIEQVLPELRAALSAGAAVVLQAPPGAGKTTGVPLALLGEAWLAGQRVVMLEPRRVAARAAARRMASTLTQSVGQTVGFRVRGETRVGALTRIEVVTEGVLTRWLLSDPLLEHVGLVIFDEFHERSLNADLGLALALQTQALVRPDLRLLVMSATLDGAAVAKVLGGAPVITSSGRSFPVELRYRPPRAGARMEDSVASAVRHALANDAGSVLAFLPGEGEIRRCLSALERSQLPDDVRLLPLFGALSSAAQDDAIAPASLGERKVVLATSIAETSLTIEGIGIVVDGGAARAMRFSPRTGLSRLETIRVSRSSADQRSGRAGRSAPGVCYRLWMPEEDRHLVDRAQPEILESDLASAMLDLAVAGVEQPSALRWIDIPPAPAVAQAHQLLRHLGALDAAHRITAHGRTMASLGLHPRLSHMLLAARTMQLGGTACIIAALLEERDILRRFDHRTDVDLRGRISIVTSTTGEERHDVDRDALRRVREQSRSWRRLLRIEDDELVDDALAGQLLALAYPERVAQRRGGAGNRYLLRNGCGAVLDEPGSLAAAAYLVVADLDGKSPDSRIYLAAPLERSDLVALFAPDIQRSDLVMWDRTAGTVTAVQREHLGAIVLREVVLRDADADAISSALVDALARGDGLSLSWSTSAVRLRQRIGFARSLDASWPDLSDAVLASTLNEWLRPHLAGLRRRSDIDQLDLYSIVLDMLTWEQRRQLDELAPTHLVVPSGSRIPVDYAEVLAPSVAVRLQEMFGCADTPRIAAGRVAVTLHLLSPAHRPVQVTRDLAGFWRTSYFAVRKDLRGRYPRHEWPLDPLGAAPTTRPRRRVD